MATTASIKYRFDTPYKAGTKRWSTTFHVTGGNWQDQAHFDTFSDNAESEIRSATGTRTTIVDSTGYNAGSDLPVFSKSYNHAGTYAPGSFPYAALEMCILVRFTTDQRSAKNHPIYLFNWIHGVYCVGLTTPETPLAGQQAAWTTRAADWVAGYSDGTLTRHRAGPRGAVAQSGAAESYLQHRDFPS